MKLGGIIRRVSAGRYDQRTGYYTPEHSTFMALREQEEGVEESQQRKTVRRQCQRCDVPKAICSKSVRDGVPKAI